MITLTCLFRKFHCESENDFPLLRSLIGKLEMFDPFNLPGLVPGNKRKIPTKLAYRNSHCLQGWNPLLRIAAIAHC